MEIASATLDVEFGFSVMRFMAATRSLISSLVASFERLIEITDGDRVWPGSWPWLRPRLRSTLTGISTAKLYAARRTIGSDECFMTRGCWGERVERVAPSSLVLLPRVTC